jgi:hypothetical protein
MSDAGLMQYFEFDEADLQANRSGNFSEKQKKELSSRDSASIQRRRLAAVLFFILGIILCLLVIGFLTFKGAGDFARNGGFYICPGLGGGALLLISIFIFRSSFSVRQNYVLKKVEAPINIIQAERTIAGNASRHHFVHELHIGGISFDVLPDLPNIMLQGDVYAVYYTEGNDNFGDRIWSAEFVSKAK